MHSCKSRTLFCPPVLGRSFYHCSLWKLWDLTTSAVEVWVLEGLCSEILEVQLMLLCLEVTLFSRFTCEMNISRSKWGCSSPLAVGETLLFWKGVNEPWVGEEGEEGNRGVGEEKKARLLLPCWRNSEVYSREGACVSASEWGSRVGETGKGGDPGEVGGSWGELGEWRPSCVLAAQREISWNKSAGSSALSCSWSPSFGDGRVLRFQWDKSRISFGSE